LRSTRTTSRTPTPWPLRSTTSWPANHISPPGGRSAKSDREPQRPRGVAWTLPHCCGNEPYRTKPWLTSKS
jgi:hypothetical protein